MALVDVQDWAYNSETVSVVGTVDGVSVGATGKFLPLKALIDDYLRDRTAGWVPLKKALAKLLKEARQQPAPAKSPDVIEV